MNDCIYADHLITRMVTVSTAIEVLNAALWIGLFTAAGTALIDLTLVLSNSPWGGAVMTILFYGTFALFGTTVLYIISKRYLSNLESSYRYVYDADPPEGIQ